jgi:hypothetical protein
LQATPAAAAAAPAAHYIRSNNIHRRKKSKQAATESHLLSIDQFGAKPFRQPLSYTSACFHDKVFQAKENRFFPS